MRALEAFHRAEVGGPIVDRRPYIDPDRSRPSCDVGLANDPYLALLIAIAIVSNLWDFVVQVPRNR